MASDESRSCPSGFSSTTRTLGVFRPVRPSCSQIGTKIWGAVAR